MTEKLLTIADLARFSSIGDLAISPIGTRVAFARQRMDLRDNTNTSEIWLAICYTRFAKRLTVSTGRDRWPVWSPDGLRLAFVSDRTGKRQIYLMDPDGGEPEIIATEHEPTCAPVWSPDGKTIAFCADVRVDKPAPRYPGAPAEEMAHSRHRPVVITALHHKQDGRGFFGDSFSHVFSVAAKPTEKGCSAWLRQITNGRHNHFAPVWSPDGRHMLCIANRQRSDDDPFWDRQLWLVDVETGAMSKVFSEDYRVKEAAWSCEGKLAVIGFNHELNRLSEIDQLFVLDFEPAKAPYSWTQTKDLTSELDRSVGISAPSETRLQCDRNLLFSKDGRYVYFVLADRGESHIWRADVHDCTLEKQTPGEQRAASCPTLSDNGWLAYTSSRVDRPDEIFVLSPKGNERKISALNAVRDEFSLAKADRLLYKAKDGWDIEGWYLRAPQNQSAPSPAIISVHGGPHGMFGYGFSLLHQLLAAAGYTVFYANPRASSGYGRVFHNAVEGDWGGGDYEDLMSGLDALQKEGVIDPDALGITGWSYGGYMTCWAVGHTDRFKAAVAGACISNQHDRYGTSDIGVEDVETSVHHAAPWTNPQALVQNSPLTYAGEVKTPLLLLCGELDLRCPISQTEQMYVALVRQDKPAVFVRYPDEYHSLKQPFSVLDRYGRTLAWFEHYLKPIGVESKGAPDDV